MSDSDCLGFSGRFAVFFLLFLFARCESKSIAYVAIEGDDLSVHQVSDASEIPSNYVVKAVYDNQINNTGWAFLELHANELLSTEYNDEKQAFAAGLIEGVLTNELIWMYWVNTMEGICKDQQEACDRIANYVDINERWVNEHIAKFGDSNPYWYQVKLYMKQLEGLDRGYAAALTDKTKQLSYKNMVAINMHGDLEDLFVAMGTEQAVGSGHCSALIKILPDGSDVFVAQETWTSYQSMIRIQKKYVLKYKILPNAVDTIKGHTMSFSSYPGILSSADDFYITSANLVTQETTIGNANKDLWQFISPTGQVMQFVRSMVANRLAGTGQSWTDIFRKYNSGTYNNQWMVVDYKKFAPGKKVLDKIRPGFLWILEQIPGTVEAQDMTSILKKQGYWPSYNIAYFPKIFNMSGGPESVKKFGDWFTYDKNPRAQIFKRDQGKIRNMDDMYAMMRYNDFKHDPLSRCDCNPPYSADNAIAARNDLNKANGTYPFKALGHRSHGATDTKITNMHLATTFQFLSVSGPTHNAARGIPPFRWSEMDFGATLPHLGHPDLWEFKPLTFKWEWGSR